MELLRQAALGFSGFVSFPQLLVIAGTEAALCACPGDDPEFIPRHVGRFTFRPGILNLLVVAGYQTTSIYRKKGPADPGDFMLVAHRSRTGVNCIV